jgi:hypothetical protein
VSSTLHNRSVLIYGAPGAGKSNVVYDIEQAAIASNVPMLRIAMHINAGSSRDSEETKTLLDRFREKSRLHSGLFIVDNVDYAGYKGGGRTRSATRHYNESILTELTATINDPSVYSIGTAHSDEWREHKWQWQDSTIDEPARNLLGSYTSNVEFEGDMALFAMRDFLLERVNSRQRAAHIAIKLQQLGLSKFFFANHIDPDLFTIDQNSAISQVKQGRQQRIRGKSAKTQDN